MAPEEHILASLVPWKRDPLPKGPERGARLARREAREYREYLSAEQRRQPGCPARELGDGTGFQGTSPANEKSFMLRHFDGHVFVYHPYEETPHCVGPGASAHRSVRLMRHAWVTSISETEARTDVLR